MDASPINFVTSTVAGTSSARPSTIQISGVLTFSDWVTFVSNHPLAVTFDTDRACYVLQSHIELISGADLSQFGNIVLDMGTLSAVASTANSYSIYYHSGWVDKTFRNTSILFSSPRRINNRRPFIDVGGGFFSGENCEIWNLMRGGTTTDRFLLQLSTDSQQGMTIRTAEGVIQEISGIEILQTGRYSNFNYVKIGRFMVQSLLTRNTLAIVRNLNATSDDTRNNAGMALGTINYASAMFIGGSSARQSLGITTTNTRRFFHNEASYGGGQPHDYWIYLLGSISQYWGTTAVTAGAFQMRTNNTHVVLGGFRQYQIIDGEGMFCYYYDNRAGTRSRRKFFPDISDNNNYEMLEDVTRKQIPANERMEIVTQSELWNNDNNFASMQGIADQGIYFVAYTKRLIYIDCSMNPTLETGTDENGTPLQAFDDNLVTNTNTTLVFNYTILDTAQKTYDYAKYVETNFFRGSHVMALTRDGDTIVGNVEADIVVVGDLQGGEINGDFYYNGTNVVERVSGSYVIRETTTRPFNYIEDSTLGDRIYLYSQLSSSSSNTGLTMGVTSLGNLFLGRGIYLGTYTVQDTVTAHFVTLQMATVTCQNFIGRNSYTFNESRINSFESLIFIAGTGFVTSGIIHNTTLNSPHFRFEVMTAENTRFANLTGETTLSMEYNHYRTFSVSNLPNVVTTAVLSGESINRDAFITGGSIEVPLVIGNDGDSDDRYIVFHNVDLTNCPSITHAGTGRLFILGTTARTTQNPNPTGYPVVPSTVNIGQNDPLTQKVFTEPDPPSATDQDTRIRLNLSNFPDNSEWTLWRGEDTSLDSIIDGALDSANKVLRWTGKTGGETASELGQPTGEDFIQLPFSGDVHGSYTIIISSQTTITKIYSFQVMENTLDTTQMHVITRITVPPPIQEVVNTTQNLGSRSIVTLGDLDSQNRMQFEFNGMPYRGDDRTLDQHVLPLWSQARQSQNYNKTLGKAIIIRSILSISAINETNFNYDIFDLIEAVSGVNLAGGAYILLDSTVSMDPNNDPVPQYCPNMYDTLDTSKQPFEDLTDSLNITVGGGETESPQVLTRERLRGQTEEQGQRFTEQIITAVERVGNTILFDRNRILHGDGFNTAVASLERVQILLNSFSEKIQFVKIFSSFDADRSMPYNVEFQGINQNIEIDFMSFNLRRICFRNLTLTGEMGQVSGGEWTSFGCRLRDVDRIDGTHRDSLIRGILRPDDNAFLNIHTAEPNSPFSANAFRISYDLAHNGATVRLRNISGNVQVNNMVLSNHIFEISGLGARLSILTPVSNGVVNLNDSRLMAQPIGIGNLSIINDSLESRIERLDLTVSTDGGGDGDGDGDGDGGGDGGGGGLTDEQAEILTEARDYAKLSASQTMESV